MVFISDKVAVAIQFQQAGNLAEAELIYRQTISAEPNNAAAWHLLGTVSFQKGRHDDAVACIERALQIEPNYAEALNSLGLVFRARGNGERATTCFRRAAEGNPPLAEAHLNLGNVLKDQQRLDEAIACYRQALELKPAYSDAMSNLAGALKDQGRFEEAIAGYRRSLEFEPNFHEAHHNLGVALWDAGRIVEGADSIRRAIELSPNYAKARQSLSMLQLLQGDFAHGWAEFEWRWKTGQLRGREFAKPRWHGEDLTGKTILLHAEQGLGDTIQFIRYAPIVKSLGATVVVECQKRLVELVSRMPDIDRIVPMGSQFPDFDFHAPLLSLPGILKTTLATIPCQLPYLSADPGLVALWREKLKTLSGFRIGIGWRGRPGAGPWQRRDLPLDAFLQLANIPGINSISLQKSPSREELSRLQQSLDFFDPGEFVDELHGGFMDTAAILVNLDLVITSDTALPHLAGALGVPVWVALPFVPDWRWLLHRSDSPWYPTMRLFRQKHLGDWQSVFQDICSELKNVVSSKTRRDLE